MTTKRQVRKLLKPLVAKHDDLAYADGDCGLLVVLPVRHFLRAVGFRASGSKEVFYVHWRIEQLFLFLHVLGVDQNRDVRRAGRAPYKFNSMAEHDGYPRSGQRTIRPWLWDWEDPTMPGDFERQVERDVLPLLREPRGFEDIFDLNVPFRSRGWNYGNHREFAFLLALGRFDELASFCRKTGCYILPGMLNEFRAGLGDRIKRKGDDISRRDRGYVVEFLHHKEEEFVRVLRLEQVWEPTPFPLELTGRAGGATVPAARSDRAVRSASKPLPRHRREPVLSRRLRDRHMRFAAREMDPLYNPQASRLPNEGPCRALYRAILERHDDIAFVAAHGGALILRPVRHFARALLVDDMPINDKYMVIWRVKQLFGWNSGIWTGYFEEVFRAPSPPSAEADALFEERLRARVRRPRPWLWEYADPAVPADFLNKVEQQVLPKLRALQRFEDYFDLIVPVHERATRYVADREIPFLLAMGRFSEAAQSWKRSHATFFMNYLNDWEWGLGDRIVRQGDALGSKDRRHLIEFLHWHEEYLVRAHGLEAIWERTPFPLEEM